MRMAESTATKTTQIISIDAVVGIAGGPDHFTIAPNGEHVAFTLNLDGVRQLCVMPCSGGWPQRLTAERQDCSDPAWSPDGTRLAFVRDKGLHIIGLDGTGLRRLWKHEAGVKTPAWSPDGKAIAFYSRQRGWDQIWIIEVDAERAEPRCITPGAFDHEELAWSPDGRWIAYASVRDDLQNRDLFIVPVEGGEERTISAARGYDGSPAFAPDSRQLAYMSEADGWNHLYIADITTGQHRQLTRGEFEDGAYGFGREYAPHWSADGSRLAFLRNRGGRFDVMSIAAEGGEAQRISQHDGIYKVIGWLPGGESLLITFESPQRPKDLWRLNLDGSMEQLSFSLPASIDPEKLPLPERVHYKSRDGLDIYGWLWKPLSRTEGQRYPAVIVPHGGPSSQTTWRWFPLFALLAQEGYVVMGPDFRGSSGYGRMFRQANFGEWGHADLHDIVDGAEYLKGLDFVDPERLAIFGGSYGGYMVLCALTMAPEVFRCGIDLYGDSEIAESYRHGDRLGRRDLELQMGKPEDNAELYRRGSPVYYAERVQAPLLILHGKDDIRVVPLMSEKMIEALKIEGKYYEAHFYEGEGHGFTKPENRKDYMERVLKFLKRHLKGEIED